MQFDFDTETISPDGTGSITIGGTTSLVVPVGTTLERPPSPIQGMFRYNTSISSFEIFNGTTWGEVRDLPPIGTANQVLSVNGAGDGFEYRSVLADSNKVQVSFANGEISIDAIEANFDLANIGGTLPPSKGGTGLTSLGSANQVFGMNAAGTASEYKTLVAGTNITITHGVGTITIASSASASGTVTSVAATQPAQGLTISGSPITTSGTLVFSLANDLAAVEGLATTGVAVRTATDTWATRTLTAPAAGLTITNPAGLAGNPTFALANDLAAVEALAANGFAARTGTDAWAVRTLTAPAAGLTITNPAGTAGNPTFALANDLLQVESLATNGFAVRTGTDSWSTRIISGTTNRIAVTNGDGINGNAVIDISSSYAGQTSITTLGTVTTGVWNGTTLATGFGGTGLATIGTANQLLGVNNAGTALEYRTVGTSSYSVNVGPAGTISWTSQGGGRFFADIPHNLGTQNVVVQLSNIADNQVVFPDSITLTSATSLRVVVVGNSRTLRVVVIANGASIAAGQSTPSSVLVRDEGTLISASGFTSINFVGSSVTATDEGAGVARVTITTPPLRTLSYFATSLDSPNNSDWVVNALAPSIADPTNSAITVRQFSNSTEQGVGLFVPVPVGATNVTFSFRGRAQTAPGAAAVVQPRLYRRALANNGAVGSWSAAFEFNNIAIPTNAFFQYASQTVTLAALGITPGLLYQFELTRRVTGVTGTNLAANFLLAELTIEFT